MFRTEKKLPEKIDLGSMDKNTFFIHQALGIEEEDFRELMKKVLEKPREELIEKYKITRHELMIIDVKRTTTARIEMLWAMIRRKYTISLEEFIETIIVLRTIKSDSIPCGTAEQIQEGMLSSRNGMRVCTIPDCRVRGIDGQHSFY